jgi:hypothetical protein
VTERVADVGRGISLAYEEIGTGEPSVLAAGLGQQMHSWPTPFCERLAQRDYDVIARVMRSMRTRQKEMV